MIVNSKQLLKKAQKEKYAVPHFNINNLEWCKYILEECNDNKSPVIISVSEKTADYMGGYKTVVDIIKDMHEYYSSSYTFGSCKKHRILYKCHKCRIYINNV